MTRTKEALPPPNIFISQDDLTRLHLGDETLQWNSHKGFLRPRQCLIYLYSMMDLWQQKAKGCYNMSAICKNPSIKHSHETRVATWIFTAKTYISCRFVQIEVCSAVWQYDSFKPRVSITTNNCYQHSHNSKTWPPSRIPERILMALQELTTWPVTSSS